MLIPMNDRFGVTELWRNYAASRLLAGAELRGLLGAEMGWYRWEGVQVLDLGCGDGAIAESFAAADACVVALDIAGAVVLVLLPGSFGVLPRCPAMPHAVAEGPAPA